jgi:ribonuclease HI
MIFTDGSCTNNGKANAIAGWAYIILELKDNKYTTVVKKHDKMANGETNNTGELTAIYNALQDEIIQKCDPYTLIGIISDSLYSINVITGIYKYHVNVELITAIRNIYFTKLIQFKHIKGHQKITNDTTPYDSFFIKYNIEADELCTQ